MDRVHFEMSAKDWQEIKTAWAKIEKSIESDAGLVSYQNILNDKLFGKKEIINDDTKNSVNPDLVSIGTMNDLMTEIENETKTDDTASSNNNNNNNIEQNINDFSKYKNNKKLSVAVLSELEGLEDALLKQIIVYSLPIKLIKKPFSINVYNGIDEKPVDCNQPNNDNNNNNNDKEKEKEKEREKEFLLNLGKIELLICDPTALDKFGMYLGSNIKWIQSTFAGPDGTIKTILKSQKLLSILNNNKLILTRIGNRYNWPIAEYVVGYMLYNLRSINKLNIQQYNKIWSRKFYKYKKLDEITVGILGIGNIGMTIGKYLHNLNCNNITGFSYSKRILTTEDDINNIISKYYCYKNNELSLFLSQYKYDFLINALPSTKLTKHLLNYDILSKNIDKDCKPIWINIGRGDIIKETELIKCLNNNNNRAIFSGAILDVFENEPLNKENKLWDMENVVITPHISNQWNAKDILHVFKENLHLYLNDQSLRYTIDFDKGY